MNFHKIFLFVGWNIWHLYETSEIRVVRGELGVNSTSFHAEIDRMALKEAGKWFSGWVQEQRSMSALDQLLVRFVKEEIHPFFSIAMR